MSKRNIIFIFLLFLIFTACKEKTELSDYDKIQTKLIKMETYECEALVKYISNKGENEYSTKQYCKITGEYRIETLEPKEVKGNIILYDGNMIWQYNPNVEGKISVNSPDKPERREILLSSFIENYVKSQDVLIESANIDGGKCTVFEAKIPGDKKYFSTEKLWIDNESMLPVQLIIYDTEQKERIIVSYKSFEYNKELDNNLFNLTSIDN